MARVSLVLSALGRNLVLSVGAETSKDECECEDCQTAKELVISELTSETQISPAVLGFQPNPDYDDDEEDRRE